MIITISSVGGSPGVTSWSVLLAAAWPSDYGAERVVVEADLDGAVMGARFGIGVDPGTPMLVSATRRAGERSIDLREIGRLVDPLAWLIPGPESAEASRQLWASPGVSASVADVAATDDRIWFFDVGRAGPSGSHAAIFEKAAMSLVLCRAEHDSLVQIPARLATMKKANCATGVLVVGQPAFDVGDLQAFFGADHIWITAGGDDLVDVSRQVWGERRVKRSQSWRSAVTVATDLAGAIEANSIAPALTPSERPDAR
jgi:hypothetical protein